MVPMALGPLFYARWSGLDNELRTRQAEMASRMSSTYGIVTTVMVIVLGKYLIWLLYGKAFLGALSALWILGISLAMFPLFNVCGNLLASDGRAGITAVILAGAFVVVSTVTYLTVPWLDIGGAALGSLAANLFTVVACLAVCKKLYGLNPLKCIIIGPHDFRQFLAGLRGQAMVPRKVEPPARPIP